MYFSRLVCAVVRGFFLVLLVLSATAVTANQSIIVQSTTSTANSGLYDYLLPHFQATTGITVNVVAVGTGQAIKNAANGDADVLLVHAKTAEIEFVEAGFGVKRFDLMYNDFVIVGPASDAATIRGVTTATGAFLNIANSQSIFVSRGDDSGTHKKEVTLWQEAKINTEQASGSWYRETGSGMGATLNVASAMGAYTLTDRATWISFKNKGNLQILLEGDATLFNQYGVILVNPATHEHVNSEAGQSFIDWLLSDTGQKLIAAYTLDGQQLFFPNAD
jgi:tungstate transport system substrate-binding protein